MALSRTATTIGLVALLTVAAGAGYLGWHMYTTTAQPLCQVCSRPIHAQTKTIVSIDGKRETVCCPSCAVTAARQTGQPLELVELTDYISGAVLDPKDAFLVRGSDINPCMREHPLRNARKQMAQMDFDRCSPSVLAFKDRAAAEDFVKNHGGLLIRLEDLEAR